MVARCNKHLLGLGQLVKKSLTDEGIIGYQFGTVGVRYAVRHAHTARADRLSQ